MSTTSVVVSVVAAIVVGAAILVYRAGSEGKPDIMVLSQLRQAGSDLTKRHDIEFFVYVPTEAAANRVASSLAPQGFAAKVAPAAGGKPMWLVLATRSMIPDVGELVRLRNLLTQLAESEQGSYDGWGSPVVK